MSLHEPEPVPDKPKDIVSTLESDVDYRQRLLEIAKGEDDPNRVLKISLSAGADLDVFGKELKTIRMLTTIAKAVKKEKQLP